LYSRCAAVDVHKDQVTVAVRTPGEGPGGGRQTQVRKFRAFYGVLTDMARWLVSLQVTQVAMEATGIYTMPVYHVLIEHGQFEQVLVCNAAHVKNVPGRKTDAVDAAWLAELLECGLLRGSFIPEPKIKAVRDVIRYRKKLVGARTSEFQRLGGVLQDAPLTELPGRRFVSAAPLAWRAATVRPCGWGRGHAAGSGVAGRATVWVGCGDRRGVRAVPAA
jgi:transposase